MLATLDARILQQRFDVLQRNTPFIVLGSLLVAGALCWILWDVLPHGGLVVWLGLLGLHAFARVLFWSWLRQRPPRPARLRLRTRQHVALSLVSGALWGGGALWLFQTPQLDHHLLITFMLAGMVTSSLHSQTAHLPAFHAFFLPCAAAGVVGNLLVGGREHWAVALAVFAYCLLAVRFARTLNSHFTEAWRARFEIAELAERLREEKERAEQANKAKSRFLAAASHDLRQPVHALSLFVGSLRLQALDASARDLVAHAGEAVKSMEAMFSALLDMSRLDAGVVQVETRVFALAPLLSKLASEMRPMADAKGLRWRVRSTGAMVHSDPLLLERILRNLLANALRYTEHGTVLLGCRRRGAHLEIQVCDTGCGIASERHHELFREFVQLQPTEAHRQGLGLGLAIVKRLAELLHHPVALASEPGRGSVFGVTVPMAEGPAALQPAPLNERSVGTPALLPGRWAVVLDDDEHVCTAMTLLLTGWGLQVVAAVGYETLRPQLAGLPECPALIVSDLGLGAGLDGLEAIRRLREEFNGEIPAIVVTGNTSPERLREVRDAGHPLLHKPLAPVVLHETIATLLVGHPASIASPP